MKLKNVKFGTKVMVKNNQNNQYSVFNDEHVGKQGVVTYLHDDGDVIVYFPTNDKNTLLGYDSDFGHYSNLKLVKEVSVDE